MPRLWVPVLLLTACIDGGPGSPLEPTIEYDLPGPFPVGTQTVEVVVDADLTLEVQIWYPAASSTEALHDYLLGFTGVALDAPAANCDQSRPVALFSHGDQGLRYQSIFLTEHLASHGYVVAAPDHVYNTTFDYDETAVAEVALRRPSDLSNAFDGLVAAPEVEGCVDEAAGFAALGHSFGGYTTLAIAGAQLDLDHLDAGCGDGWLCGISAASEATNPGERLVDLADPRVWAAVPMAHAGQEVFGSHAADIQVPLLVLGGSDDQLTPWATQAELTWAELTATPRFLAQLDGATHYSFSDACELLPTPEFCRGETEIPAVHRLVKGMTTAFLDSVLGVDGGDADLYLPPDDPRVAFDQK